jgi:hypothetical protein
VSGGYRASTGPVNGAEETPERNFYTRQEQAISFGPCSLLQIDEARAAKTGAFHVRNGAAVTA